MVIIILQYVSVSNQHVVYLKLTQCSMLIISIAGGKGGFGEASSESETEISVLKAYYLESTVGAATCGKKGKDSGLGREKVECDTDSAKASTKPVPIYGAGMALHSCPASGQESQALMYPGIKMSTDEEETVTLGDGTLRLGHFFSFFLFFWLGDSWRGLSPITRGSKSFRAERGTGWYI